MTATEPRATRSRVYFPGLNSLRFFAAAAVWFTHAMAVLQGFGFPSVVPSGWIHPDTGKLGVILFFVLSGFLITYLLQTEKGRTGTVFVWRFYVRRALRIWPIYYLMVVVGFFVLPWAQSESVQSYVASRVGTDLPLYVFFLPNLARYIPLIAHLWSVGAEEQFYLVWPWLHRVFSSMYLVCIAVILLQPLVLLALQNLGSETFSLRLLFHALQSSRFDCMAIGGVVAVLLFDNVTPALRVLMWRGTLPISLALLGFLYGQDFGHPIVGFPVFGGLFALIILNVAANPRSLIRAEWRWTDYLGRISYGIYVYHPFVIFVTGSLAARYVMSPEQSSLATAWSLILLSGVATVGLSALSYRYYESVFLRMKKRFTVVVSSDAASLNASAATVG